MIHGIAERRVRQMFETLSTGDYEQALEGLAPRFEHRFAGDHALGGTRHTVEGFRAWFERLYRLFPNLAFEVTSVTASGPPWDLLVVAEWIDRATPAGGGTYENRGVHIIRLAWGRLASIHAYLDTQVLADALRLMSANGLEEAAAPPIGDPEGSKRQDRRTPRPHGRRAQPTSGRAIGATATGASAIGASHIGAAALGAVATGAVAIGALAIGRVAIGQLTLGRARVKRLEIDELVVHRSLGEADAPQTRL